MAGLDLSSHLPPPCLKPRARARENEHKQGSPQSWLPHLLLCDLGLVGTPLSSSFHALHPVMLPHPARAGCLKFNTAAAVGGGSFAASGCPVHCGMFPSLPGFLSVLSPACDNLRCLQALVTVYLDLSGC